MRQPYSLREVVRDGPIVAERRTHHLIKLGTSLVVFLALWLAVGGHLVWLGLVAGPGLWFVGAVREHVRPSDPTVYPLRLHVTDWITDASLATLGGLVPALVLTGHWGALTLVLGASVAGYLECHHGARP